MRKRPRSETHLKRGARELDRRPGNAARDEEASRRQMRTLIHLTGVDHGTDHAAARRERLEEVPA
ncbi:MAG TPA: hypothetical protein VND24_04110, partial [Steroidobacteraceae bacterium]|nr:hypothetical protein [Steroidobacteraceae bacterium]